MHCCSVSVWRGVVVVVVTIVLVVYDEGAVVVRTVPVRGEGAVVVLTLGACRVMILSSLLWLSLLLWWWR